MTNEQTQQLVNKLHGTTLNVYRVAEQITGEEVGEEVFDLLREHGLFKCEECNKWLLLSEEGLTDFCNDCLDRIDGVDTETEW